jgi:hypothetical protein
MHGTAKKRIPLPRAKPRGWLLTCLVSIATMSSFCFFFNASICLLHDHDATKKNRFNTHARSFFRIIVLGNVHVSRILGGGRKKQEKKKGRG